MVESASDGAEALQLLQNRQPDIIFLDHIMPGMDGFQVLAQLKNNPLTRAIPVVMYTSQAAPKYTDEARALGAIGVMPKQVTNELLSHMLDRAEQYRQGALHGSGDGAAADKEQGVEVHSEPEPELPPPPPAPEALAETAPPVYQGGRRAADRQRQQHSTLALLMIVALLIAQLYWFYRDQQQQRMITAFTEQLQQQQLAYQEAVDDLIDLRLTNQAAMDQFQFVMDALVSQALDTTAAAAVSKAALKADTGTAEPEAEAQEIADEQQ
jgi:CheY-like chemotaxis protein